ncbi:MAG: hypothetical protein ACYC9J_04285 [Sulfuricaulis sp.]
MSSIALLPVVLVSGENLLSTTAKGWAALFMLAVVFVFGWPSLDCLGARIICPLPSVRWAYCGNRWRRSVC